MDGDCYPASAQFGPYSVTLYRESRPDVLTRASGDAAALRETRYRLRSVLVSHQGTPIRAYRLSYATSPVTGKSLLAAVEQYGKDVAIDAGGAITGGSVLPAQTFAYQDDAVGRSFARWFSDRSAGYVSAWEVGTWGACTSSAAWTCTSATSTGCSRPGTQVRTVVPSAWSASPAEAVAPPASTQACTLYTQGYVATWWTSEWSACSVSCGGGTQTRWVNPSTFKATPPDASQPPTVQSCNTQPCALTCAQMGWYWADQQSLCNSQCSNTCVKKQWCGSAPCEPWPHYCWKCP